MLMPLIPELPENLAAVTFDLEADPAVNCDVVDFGAGSNDETLLLESQAKIAGESKKLLVMRSQVIQNQAVDYFLVSSWISSCVRAAGVSGRSAGREAAARATGGESDQRAGPTQRAGISLSVCTCVNMCLCMFTLSQTVVSQLVLEVHEKEAILMRMTKQSKTMNKIKRGESS